ncbi:MAG: hypothetical protein E7E21_10150 [Peptostreptococcaceae bacterium]|nr:hypothetical protein [Peptostreptococcaceae bacterium]
MATVSFDKKISIKDDKAINVLIKGLSKKEDTKVKSKKNVIAELNTGKELLKHL